MPQTVQMSAPQVVDPKQLKEELNLLGPDEIKQAVTEKKVNSTLEVKASDFFNKLMKISVDDVEKRQLATDSIENIGEEVERRATNANRFLDQPLKRMSQLGGKDGNQIANMLGDIKVQFDELDPSGVNFDPGFLGRMFGWLPFFGRSMNKYFTQFEKSGVIIDLLFDSLEKSKQELLRDIETLKGEQLEMRSATIRLQELITVCQLIDEKLEGEMNKLEPEEEKAKFIKTELLFPLRQRITDLQQQLIVNQQGVLMFEVLVRNNKELIRGVKRCREVTKPALQIGVTCALALANQRIVIGKIEALNQMSDRLIANNAKLLKEQGAEINKRASSSQLNNEVLAKAMKDAVDALNDIDTFKEKALIQMKKAIEERDAMTNTGRKAIERMERGNKAAITLDLDEAVTGEKNK